MLSLRRPCRLVWGSLVIALLAGSGCERGTPAGSTSVAPVAATRPAQPRPAYALVIHGGAGTMTSESLGPELAARYREKLAEALAAGEAVLRADGSSLDAVVAVIQILEESELFNAGVGAVFTHEGRNELDASIMDGASLRAGAVAGVTTIKSPIAAARAVMERSPHVMLAGPGAEAFAAEIGLEIVDPSYFRTEKQWKALEEARAAGERASASPAADLKFGTVGAVALDTHGDLAAGTSTGGMTNKRWGRIGDSPIIGAGTYASNASCAVSATGHGEYFIRRTVARDICALVEFRGLALGEAARVVVQEQLRAMGGQGGVIALDPAGHVALEFNTEGMFRASVVAGEAPRVEID